MRISVHFISIKKPDIDHAGLDCTPDRTRTYYPQLRRLLLYPDELRAHAVNELQKYEQSSFSAKKMLGESAKWPIFAAGQVPAVMTDRTPPGPEGSNGTFALTGW